MIIMQNNGPGLWLKPTQRENYWPKPKFYGESTIFLKIGHSPSVIYCLLFRKIASHRQVRWLMFDDTATRIANISSRAAAQNQLSLLRVHRFEFRWKEKWFQECATRSQLMTYVLLRLLGLITTSSNVGKQTPLNRRSRLLSCERKWFPTGLAKAGRTDRPSPATTLLRGKIEINAMGKTGITREQLVEKWGKWGIPQESLTFRVCISLSWWRHEKQETRFDAGE